MRLIQRLWSTWQGQKDLDDEPDGNANVNSEEEQEEPEEEAEPLLMLMIGRINGNSIISDFKPRCACNPCLGGLPCAPAVLHCLEDVVTVKVMAAVGSGAVGAGCATALCSWPAALRWLLAPYAMHDSALGCSLVPKGDDAADMAKQYLLLSVWCWPALFVSMALKGFLLGLQEYGTFIFMGLVQTVTQIALLYILFIPDPSLDALGWIVFVGSYMSLISTLVIFCFKRELRMRYNLMINCAEAAAQACEYASSLSCSNIFASVFGGGTADGQDTLQGSGMLLFVPTLIARSFYQLYKAGLYAALDWSFMAKMAVASMSMVFLPAICIAIYLRTAGDSAPPWVQLLRTSQLTQLWHWQDSNFVSSILIAMYLPMLAMALAFILRTRRNIKRMLAGARGPWDKEL
eukprot:Skav227769  [mRNA]  locus=scaffold1237:16665:25525:+ [translate_table: standard]